VTNASANSIGTKERRELELEARVEAPVAVLLVVCLQAAVAFLSLDNGWRLWTFPWWVWLLPIAVELALVVPLALGRFPHRGRRRVAIASSTTCTSRPPTRSSSARPTRCRLSRPAKMAMLAQGSISAVAVLLVVSRAVGIF